MKISTKQITVVLFASAVLFAGGGTIANAQGMTYWNSAATTSDDILKEETEGKAIYESLQNKEKTCSSLTNDDFELLGEYFMGQRLGNSHEAMNNMMRRMLGQDGEEQMHVVMGKRLSSCDTAAAWSLPNNGFTPGFGMMSGWFNADNFNQLNNPNNMMNFGYNPFGFGFMGPIFMILFWGLIIFIIVAGIRWISSQGRGGHDHKDNSALDILKERYAKGEIDQKEFEDKKKQLL